VTRGDFIPTRIQPSIHTDEEATVKVCHKSCVGTKRELNQDRFLVDLDIGLFIVADGMGGHNAGEIASTIAISELSNSIREGLKSGTNVSVLLRESVLKAHKAIFENAMKHRDRRDMGTTVAIAVAQTDQVWLCHVGDSRVYLVGRDSIEKLTVDHTFVAEWVEEGRITPSEARIHGARHGLTMALGIDDDVEPEIRKVSWRNGQCILICSDGLTDMLEDSAILQIVKEFADPDAVCTELMTQASNRGGEDDITVILVCR
jgi:serine/threonine protein phosphatase PrpC